MSDPKMLTLRVQWSEGTTRVQLPASATSCALFESVHAALQLDSFAFALYRDRGRSQELLSSKTRRLSDLGLQHGDMLYLTPVNGARIFHEPDDKPTTSNKPNNTPEEPVKPSSSFAPAPNAVSTPQEDEVDLILYEQSGKIMRQRDDKLCRHNSKGCCVHCSPLEPWDENYLREQNIKHLSFHSYMRKITSGKFISLEEISLKIKPGCKEHPAWPRGICSYCRPGGLTLARQAYRHVDNLVLDSAALADRFLAAWRATGDQRVGFLYGRYEPHPTVPLGIRGRVSFIYEPPQEGSRDRVSLLEGAGEAGEGEPPGALGELCAALGLRRLGWIFTDLLPGERPGEVQHIRGVDTHFLSAQECITAGHFQNQHPSPCRYAADGYYGSKFLTVCVTGDSNNQVHMEGYQVSGQCQALVRENMLLPTRDAPELGYIRPSGKDQYVPDVYYKEKDSYGNEVGVSARQVPVAYLLVDVPCGVLAAGEGGAGAPAGGAWGAGWLAGGAGGAGARREFPVENRPRDPQTLTRLHELVQEGGLRALSDPHVLLYLRQNPALALTQQELDPLLAALRARDEGGLAAWAASPGPATLLQLARAHTDTDLPHPHRAGSRSGVGADADAEMAGGLGGLAAGGLGGLGGLGGPGGLWTCPLCTFHNPVSRDACEMCAMPRNSA